jgi:hypothetical protein
VSVFSPVQTSFASGELSKRLRGRVDTDVYKAGLDRCENWEPLPTGPLRKRGGTVKMASIASGARLVPLKTSSGSDYILVIGDGTIRVVNVNGGDETVGAATLDVELVGSAWVTVAGAPVYAAGEMALDPGEAMRIALTVTHAGNHTFSFENKSFAGDTLTRSIGVKVGSSPGASDVRSFSSYFRGDWGASGNVTVTFPSAGTYYLQLTAGANGTGVTVYARSISMRYVSSGGAVTGPWSLVQAASVQFVPETGVDRTVLVHPNVQPQTLTRAANGTWALDPIVFTTPPAEWAGTNWPGACEIHAGRLWLAGTPAQQNRVWASKVGELFNFALATGAASDAIDVKVSTKGAIRWMQSQKNLLFGTDQGEHYVSSVGGAPTPGDIQVVLGSMFGSAKLQPLAIGDQVLYVSPDRRKPRVIGFEYQTDGWVSRDLAFMADHLTRPLIREAHFAKAPYPTAVFVLDDGSVAACAYDRGAQQLAWWRLTLPSGSVNSATVTDGDYGSIVWLSVTRGTGIYLESFRLDDDAEHLLDAQVPVTVPASLELAGLDHLEWMAVDVVADGAIVGAGLVVAGGKVTLDDPDLEGETVVVGLPYLAKAVTLPREGGNQRGSAQGAKRRNVRVRLRLNDSAIPLVDGDRAAPDRSPSTPMGDPEPLMSGDVEVTCLGWADGVVTIEQDLPFRTEILALFANTAVHDV